MRDRGGPPLRFYCVSTVYRSAVLQCCGRRASNTRRFDGGSL